MPDTGCGVLDDKQEPEGGTAMQQKIYINGDIVTVDDRNPAAEAVVVREGRILYAGDTETALGYQNLQNGDGWSASMQPQTQHQKTAETEIIDLQGRTMLPGFIDPHSHYLMAASTANYAALSSPPIGNVESIDDIIRLLKAEIQEKRIPAGKMVLGWGYDESLLKEGRVPTNRELDQVSTTHPVYIIHQSGHKGVGSSLLLKQFGIDEAAKDPEGGHIGRYPGTNIPNGTLEEKSSMAVMMTELANPSQETLLSSLQAGGELYARNGITTAQDGAMQRASVGLAEMAGKTGLLKIDLVGYLLISSLDDFKAIDKFFGKVIEKAIGNIGETAVGTAPEFPGTAKTGPYRDHFRIGGAKLLLDGSPQAKTAWLSRPYHIPPPGEDASYRGYPFYEKDEFVTAVYEECLRRRIQVLTHANGDQASEQLITCFAQARRNTGISTDIRPVMIHAQTVREDQLDRMKELGIIPSFFQSHTYFWGDWHLNSVLGEERGMRISPVQSAIRREMVYTMHQDTPVVPPDMIFTLWTAVNRRTRSDRIIGADQRISILEAIRGLTINGARQYFEEDSKGSITPGKRADLVILDKNPLKTASDAIRDIQVMETIKDGETIYRKS